MSAAFGRWVEAARRAQKGHVVDLALSARQSFNELKGDRQFKWLARYVERHLQLQIIASTAANSGGGTSPTNSSPSTSPQSVSGGSSTTPFSAFTSPTNPSTGTSTPAAAGPQTAGASPIPVVSSSAGELTEPFLGSGGMLEPNVVFCLLALADPVAQPYTLHKTVARLRMASERVSLEAAGVVVLSMIAARCGSLEDLVQGFEGTVSRLLTCQLGHVMRLKGAGGDASTETKLNSRTDTTPFLTTKHIPAANSWVFEQLGLQRSAVMLHSFEDPMASLKVLPATRLPTVSNKASTARVGSGTQQQQKEVGVLSTSPSLPLADDDATSPLENEDLEDLGAFGFQKSNATAVCRSGVQQTVGSTDAAGGGGGGGGGVELPSIPSQEPSRGEGEGEGVAPTTLVLGARGNSPLQQQHLSADVGTRRSSIGSSSTSTVPGSGALGHNDYSTGNGSGDTVPLLEALSLTVELLTRVSSTQSVRFVSRAAHKLSLSKAPERGSKRASGTDEGETPSALSMAALSVVDGVEILRLVTRQFDVADNRFDVEYNEDALVDCEVRSYFRLEETRGGGGNDNTYSPRSPPMCASSPPASRRSTVPGKEENETPTPNRRRSSAGSVRSDRTAEPHVLPPAMDDSPSRSPAAPRSHRYEAEHNEQSEDEDGSHRHVYSESDESSAERSGRRTSRHAISDKATATGGVSDKYTEQTLPPGHGNEEEREGPEYSTPGAPGANDKDSLGGRRSERESRRTAVDANGGCHGGCCVVQ